jgi:hypothetical protein
MSNSWWMIVPGNPALSGVVIFLIAVPFLYAARNAMHGAIRGAVRSISSPLRLASRWLIKVAGEMRQRNKVVMLAQGREEMKHTIEREFERIGTMIQRDLHGYPALQRKLMDEITKIEEDYQKCGEVPPPSGQWAEAVSAVANITPSNGLVEKILEDIADSIEKIHQRSLAEYRKAYQDRHKILKGFAPFWRSLNQTLGQVDRNLEGLQNSSEKIDAQMDKFQEIIRKTDKAEHMLAQSASRQFMIDAFVMTIAVLGAFINSRLIELPLREMVGSGQYVVGNISVSDVASMVIIFFETIMGIFLMETLGITHLFAGIGNLTPVVRKRWMWFALALLLFFAFIEVGLALMRDSVAAARMSLISQLSESSAAAFQEASKVANDTGWVGKMPMVAQAALGFILPFALAFVAVPLESFISSARTVLGVLSVWAILALAFAFRVISTMMRYVGNTLVNLYDVVIFLPLAIERLVRVRGSATERRGKDRGGVTSFPKRNSGERTATGEF